MKTVDSKVTAEEAKDAIATLFRIVTDEKVKLRWGLTKREQLRKDLEAGRPLRGYRAEFMREACNAALLAIREKAMEFNRVYKHDRISPMDLMDVLRTAINKIRLKAG